METKQFITIKEASRWASDFLKRDVSESNIFYLVQYGKVKKHNGGSATFVDLNDLKNYYDSYRSQREISWKKRLGNDLNWTLSFDHLREKDTTKHVHRLHPYKGKFIPQLVEYFIDSHVDDLKTDTYFKKGDIILDPFSGSGTTLVQAIEVGMHSIGIDISHFNCTIAETKLLDYDFVALEDEIKKIKQIITGYETDKIDNFENELLIHMADFNNKYFPSPGFKYKIQSGLMNESRYVSKKEQEFLKVYNNLIKRYAIKLNHSTNKTFLDKWYMENVRKEIDFAFEQIKKIKDIKNKKILAIILSRTIRSCRATTHSDLATLKEPQLTTYYCWKHKKICKPLFSIKSWFDRYASDTIDRLKTFARLKQNSYHYAVLPADSRTVDIFKEIEKRNKKFYEILKKQKIAGIFTSPPYVGQIDYHEQHAYAYDLFGFKRRDELEIGPLYKGQGIEARESYIEGISKVLLNCKKYLTDNFNIFLVANDKYNLYPAIAEKAEMKIVDQFKRPVLNRTERDKSPYSEIIFHLKKL